MNKKILLLGLCILLLFSFTSATILTDIIAGYSKNDDTVTGTHIVDIVTGLENITFVNAPDSGVGIIAEGREWVLANSDYGTTGLEQADFGNKFCFATWVNPNSLATNQYVIGSSNGGATDFLPMRIEIGGQVLMQVRGTLGSDVVTSTNTLTVGTYAHIVNCWEQNGRQLLYWNGTLHINESTLNQVSGQALPAWFGAWNNIGAPLGHLDVITDETYIRVGSFWSSAEVLELFEAGRNELSFPFVASVLINESLESTLFDVQVGSLVINSAIFQDVLDFNFNISVANTSMYFEATTEIESAVMINTAECRILIDNTDTFGSVTSITGANAGIKGNLASMTNNFSRDVSSVNAKFQCRRLSGGGGIILTDAHLVGHLLKDEFNRSINHKSVNFTSSISSVPFINLKNYVFNISNLFVTNTEGVVSNFVINWRAEYTNNGASAEVLSTVISINGTNCSFFPRNIQGSGGIGVASGICNLNNVSANSSLNISVLGSGSNADFNFMIHNVEFLTHIPQLAGIDLTGLTITNTVFTKIANFSGGNTDHSDANVFVKAGIPLLSNLGVGFINASFFLRLSNSVNLTSEVITRHVNASVGVAFLQHIFPNALVADYQIELWGSCGNCSIEGGQMVAYVTDVTTIISNDFLVTVNNSYNDASILIFNVTSASGAIFSSNITGTAVINSIFSFDNLTITSPTFISETILLHNASQDLTVSIAQSKTTVFTNFKKDGSKILAFNITDGTIIKFTSDGNLTLPLNAGNYSLIVDANGYNKEFVSYEALSLSTSGIINRSLGNTTLNISAHNLLSGVPITSFSATIISSDGFYSENKSTITGKLNFSNFVDNFTLIVDADGFALQNFSINQANLSQFFNASLFTTNSLNITFKNAKTNALMSGINVTISFLGLTNQTNITDTGNLYVDLFSPDEYTLIYSAIGFNQGQYIITITNRSTQALTLYLQNSTITQLILITVTDKFGKELQGADVTIQRYENDGWFTEQIVRTDFQGRAEGYFILSTTFYNFLIDYQGSTFFGVPNDNINKKVIYAEDVNTGLNFRIDILGDELLLSVNNIFGVPNNLTYIESTNTTGFFRFYYNDIDNNELIACLEVIRGSNEIICSCESTTITSESSTLICNINQSSGTATYRAVGIISDLPVASKIIVIGQSTQPDWGGIGYFVAFIAVILSYFIFIKSSPSISLIFGTSVITLCSIFGLIFRRADFGVFILLFAIAWTIASIKSESGVNG